VQLDGRRSAEDEEGFGSLLRRYRALAGLSQEALAERAGISRRGIADLERGPRRFPYPDTASRLAAALELSGAQRATFMAACRPRPRASTRRYALQIEPSPLVGRQRELAEISQLVAGSRILTLTGTGGIGKTRVALELAHQLESEYADGAVLIDLAPVHDAELVPQADFVGRHTGEFAGIPATGREVRVPYSVHYDLNNGDISALRIYNLAAGLVSALK
jgi:transcriptional regulator with XRE-family HTH domain